MASIRDEELETAVKRAVRESLAHGRTQLFARSLAALAQDTEDVSRPVTPRDVGKYLNQNRDLGFVEVEKRDDRPGSTMWVLHEKDDEADADA